MKVLVPETGPTLARTGELASAVLLGTSSFMTELFPDSVAFLKTISTELAMLWMVLDCLETGLGVPDFFGVPYLFFAFWAKILPCLMVLSARSR